MLVLLKNLCFRQSIIPQGAHTSPPASTGVYAHHANDGSVTALPQIKNADDNWVSTTTSIDVEAGSIPRNPLTANPKASIMDSIRNAFSAVKNFHPTPRMISDAIIGLADGMTVPFALTAGLSTLGSTHIVVLGGVAELVAGMISMGVGGALGAKAESDGFQAKLADTTKLVLNHPAEAIALVHDVLRPFGFDPQQRNIVVEQLSRSSERMVDWLMRFHYQEKQPDPSRPLTCGITIGLGYAIGGLIPLIPYFCVRNDQILLALYISIGVMLVTLFLFGFFKTVLLAEKEQDKSTWNACVGGFWMLIVGGAAAAVAVGVVHGINTA
ncbi:MAG: hypothetical protein L6R37_004290 [Teloschistes peruensis]|nr:MAG: hypothetical protein L6R37_004290 [Teloschistes peruensis]